MKDIISFLNSPRKDVTHLTMLWRIVLFPTIFIWWFIFQLFALSFFGGAFLIIMGIFGMVSSFGSSNWREDFSESFGFFILPFISPFIWLYKYFVLGEFNTLMEE